jgi:hypothetical protein
MPDITCQVLYVFIILREIQYYSCKIIILMTLFDAHFKLSRVVVVESHVLSHCQELVLTRSGTDYYLDISQLVVK